jgi:hypothetical protein
LRITSDDKTFYYGAIDFLTERFEMVRNFTKFNGLPAASDEDMSEMLIGSIKTWLISEEGERWLQSIGYIKYEQADAITVSGCIIIPSGLFACPVCSGYHSDITTFL